MRDFFDVSSQPTLGVEFLTKVVKSKANGKQIQLQLWDTAGQEVFRAVTRGYYRGSAGAVLVFDLCNRESFDNIERWLTDVREAQGVRHDAVIILLGNKVDVDDDEGKGDKKRVVTTAEAQGFANQRQLLYFETSAKTGRGVVEAFDALIVALEKRMDEGAFDTRPAPGAQLEAPAAQDSGGCC